MEVIKTDAGYVSGTVLGEPDKPIYVYRGIPYAAPPVGELRWKAPQPVNPWSGIRECTVFSKRAPQTVPSFAPYPIPSSEDCLYLNVLTPARQAAEGLPVMVWMHGGGYSAGHGNTPQYTSISLPQRGVVTVTVNMRLGPLGLMAHPLLSEESPNHVSGNYLFLDMIAALEWVKRNIASFGGDPGNVTIFGESGGSGKVICMMASPLAKGLFHRAIGESGTPTGILLKDTETLGDKLFAKLGVSQEKDPLKAAREISWERIIEADQALCTEMGAQYSLWDISVDGWCMPDTPARVFQAGKQNAVPFIMGANLGELTGPGSLVIPHLIPYYTALFSAANKAHVKAYAYIFDQVPEGWKQDGCVSCHAMELGYVFGIWDDLNDWAQLMPVARPAGAKRQNPGVTSADRKVSEAMMSLWTQFARTGDPSVAGLIEWPNWEQITDQYLYIAEPLQVKSGFSRVSQK
jgi:para-nitrobenzyl esterase